MQAEAALHGKIILELTSGSGPYRITGLTLFQNSVGGLYDQNGRLVKYGLCQGSSDLIGLLAPAATFVAIEVKIHGHRTDPERLRQQLNFIAMVIKSGGIAGMAESVEEAHALVLVQAARLPPRAQTP